MITALPDVLRACLSEAADCADPLTDGELEEFLDTYQGGDCVHDNCCNAIAGPVTKFDTKVEDGAGRHDTLVEVAPWVMSEAMGGCYSARDAFNQLYDAFSARFTDAEPERVHQLGDEYTRIMAWAAAQADPSRAHREQQIDEERLWTARPILQHIYTSSLAQQMDPRGMLVAHLVRAIASIPPYVTLPGITAARASLNLHVALVGPSSSGKSSSVAVARAALAVTPEPAATSLGSGEGIAKHYAYRDTKTKEIVTETDTLLFVDTEIESVEALAKRSSSPLMSQWRKTFTGERLGFGYADLKNRIPVLDHKYRFCQILGIQPELAGWLLTGTQAAGGTPQRILWAPVVYPDMPPPEDLPEWPRQQVLPAWPKPSQPSDGDEQPTDNGEMKLNLRWRRQAVDEPADENTLREHELKVPEEVGALVRDARYRFHKGEVHELAGHATLTRLKVAAGLMWLDGRTDKITMEDWDLAGIVMQISDRTRRHVLEALKAKDTKAFRARGKAQGLTEIAKAGVLADELARKVNRVADGIEKKLKEQDGQTLSDLKRSIAYRDREHVEPAVEILEQLGRIRTDDITGPNGQPGKQLWLIR